MISDQSKKFARANVGIAFALKQSSYRERLLKRYFVNSKERQFYRNQQHAMLRCKALLEHWTQVMWFEDKYTKTMKKDNNYSTIVERGFFLDD